MTKSRDAVELHDASLIKSHLFLRNDLEKNEIRFSLDIDNATKKEIEKIKPKLVGKLALKKMLNLDEINGEPLINVNSEKSINRNTSIKPTDIIGKPVTAHLEEETDQQNQAAEKIQTWWHQSYRAKILHRKNILFGIQSKDSRHNRFGIRLPAEFSHLLNEKIPPLFQTTKHHTKHLNDLLHDGVIYSSYKSRINGICTMSDELKFDKKLVFTTPAGNYGKIKIELSIEELLRSNNKKSIYFKVNDWACSLRNEIKICEDVSLRIINEFPNYKISFIDQQKKELYSGVISGGECVYHGVEGLNEYLTFFIFKIIKIIPEEKKELRDRILGEFAELDKNKNLISYLQNITKKICVDPELNSVSPLKLTFNSILKISVNGREFDIGNLRKKINEDDFEYVKSVCEDSCFDWAVRDSWFFVTGMRRLAFIDGNINIVEYLEKKYKSIFDLISRKAKDAINKHAIAPMLMDEFFSTGEIIKKASTKDIGVYLHNVLKKLWYIKFYPTNEQAKTEVLAAKLYQAAGVLVPETTLIQRGYQLGVASEGKNDITSVGDLDLEAGGYSQLLGCHESFVIDAWLANWDVSGLHKDNLYVANIDGNKITRMALRIDFGGALHFRATGKYKNSFFSGDGIVDELISMRDPSINQNNADIFNNISMEDLKIGAARLKQVSDSIIEQLVISCFPEECDKALRKKMIRTLSARRNYITNKYALTLSDPIELIARDILGRHYQKGTIKMKHGAMHASRVAINIVIMAGLYEKTGCYSISKEDVKLMQIAALFHDAGRENDEGNDCAKWERAGEKLCCDYLLSLGVSHKKASQISDSIANKDSDITKNKSIYRKLLQNADCLDVLRSHHWKFDYRYMDFYKEFRWSTNLNLTNHFYELIDQSAALVARTGDLPNPYKSMSPSSTDCFDKTWSENKKYEFETDKHCYQRIIDNMTGLDLLTNVFISSSIFSTPSHSIQPGVLADNPRAVSPMQP